MNTREQLELFKKRADELENSRLIRNGFSANLNIKLDENVGLTPKLTEPDEEDLRSFLLTFRHFVSNDEPVFLNKIYNLLHTSLTSVELKGFLIESRKLVKAAQKTAGLQLEYNGEVISPEKILNMWINGHYFHNDEELKKKLDELIDSTVMLVRFNFLDFLIETSKQILNVRDVINETLEKNLLTTPS